MQVRERTDQCDRENNTVNGDENVSEFRNNYQLQKEPLYEEFETQPGLFYSYGVQ